MSPPSYPAKPMVSTSRDRRLAERGEEISRVAARRDADGDVAGLGTGDQLAGEDEFEADIVAQRGEHCGVASERARGTWISPRRRREQHGNRRGIGGAPTVAKREQPAAPAEAIGHRRGDRLELSPLAVEGVRPEHVAVRSLGPCRGGQVVEQSGSNHRVPFEEWVEELAHDGSSRTTAIAVPA